MNTRTKLTHSHAYMPDVWKPLAKVAALVVTLLLCAATSNAYTLITLTGDTSQSSTPYDHTTADGLSYTLNDSFAYNPTSPTSPLPVQSYYVRSQQRLPREYARPRNGSVHLRCCLRGLFL